MKRCPNCKKQYDDSWKICLNCNIELMTEVSGLISELNELKALSATLNERIKIIEKKVGLVSETKSPEEEKIIPQKKEKVVESHKTEIPSEISDKNQSLESQIGRIWFNRIGVLAIIFGMAYFLKYAFDNNWIGELGRVIMGLLAGMTMIAVGEIAQKKNYKYFSEGLIAGGASVIYLSIYAAFNFYHLISAIPAFMFMAVVTLYAGIFSVRFNSPRVLCFGIIGGFLTPFLISSPNVNPILFMGYILVLDICILFVSYFKKYDYCNLIALVFTYISYSLWFAASYQHQYIIESQSFVIIIFILFSLIGILYNFINKKLADQGDVAVVLINGICYFLSIYGILAKENISYKILGFVSIGLAIIYLIFSYSALIRTERKDKNLIFSYLGLTLLFATLAIPIELQGYWITIGFILESTILVWLGFKIEFRELRVVGLAVAICALFRLGFMDFEASKTYDLILNKRFFTYLILFIGVLISAYNYKKNKNIISEEEKPIATILVLSAAVILLINFTNEINSYFYGLRIALNRQNELPYMTKSPAGYVLTNIEQFSISAMWAAYSFILIMIGMFRKFRALRLMALIIFAVTIFKVFIVDMCNIGQIWRILSFIGLGAILVITSLFYQKYKDKIIEFVAKD